MAPTAILCIKERCQAQPHQLRMPGKEARSSSRPPPPPTHRQPQVLSGGVDTEQEGAKQDAEEFIHQSEAPK